MIMRIAIDVTPIKEKNSLHKVRGSGEYINNLINSLKEFESVNKNNYFYFSRGEKLPLNIDLVHVPYFDPFFFTLPLTFSIPTIVTIHDMIPFVFSSNFPSGIKGQIIWAVQKLMLRKVSAIITDSISSKKDIVKFLPFMKNRIHVIYLAPGVEYKVLNKKLLEGKKITLKYNIPDKFLLYVGDATWNKNLPRLIEAVKQTELTLVIVGSAFLRKKVSENFWDMDLSAVLKKIEGNKQFRVLGYVPDEDLVALYNLATLFVFPSLYEGFGLPVLEAMSCGCPVLTSKKGSLEEIAGDVACFVDPYSIDDIRTKIAGLFTDEKKRNELSEKGIIQAAKFSWHNTAEKTLQVYRDVINQK